MQTRHTQPGGPQATAPVPSPGALAPGLKRLFKHPFLCPVLSPPPHPQRNAHAGVKARVVSMPCWELFYEQSQEYKDSVFPPAVSARVSVEAATSFGWGKWLGLKGIHVGIDEFGASAPANILYEKFGITVPKIIEAAKKSMSL